MSCTVVFNHYRSGVELTLVLLDRSGAVVSGEEPVDLIEPEDKPGRYEAEIEEELDADWYMARVIDEHFETRGYLYTGHVKIEGGGVFLIDDPAASEHIPPTAAEIRTELESAGTTLTAVKTRVDALKDFDPASDKVQLADDQAVDVRKVAGTSVAGVDDFKADVTSLATGEQVNSLSIPTAAEIRTELDNNSSKLANLDAKISTRSTLTAAQVWAHSAATTLATAIGTITTQVAAIVGKLPTSSKLAGSPNADGSIEVDVGPVTIEGDVWVAGFRPSALQQLAGMRQINITVPTLLGRQLTDPLIQGDTYSAATGSALEFSRSDFPDLPEGCSVALTARQRDGEQVTTFTIVGEVTQRTGAKVVRLEASAAESREWQPGKYEFDVAITWPEGETRTFVGPGVYLQVLADVTA